MSAATTAGGTFNTSRPPQRVSMKRRTAAVRTRASSDLLCATVAGPTAVTSPNRVHSVRFVPQSFPHLWKRLWKTGFSGDAGDFRPEITANFTRRNRRRPDPAVTVWMTLGESHCFWAFLGAKVGLTSSFSRIFSYGRHHLGPDSQPYRDDG